MSELWSCCANKKQGQGHIPCMEKIAAKVVFDINTDNPNIEEFLSKCEAFLQVYIDDDVSKLYTYCKKTILERCSFVSSTTNLDAHKLFLQRLSRRRTRDSRLKVFTTNYDLCFEQAAGVLGLVVLDGFSFNRPRYYDPRYFLYDIVRRPRSGEDVGNYLEGVIQLYKLHGSVSWNRERIVENGIDREIIKELDISDPSTACIIYPAKGKYQQTYIQPHLELFAQFLSTLREPNTCLIVTGFGFNDDHLSEPILSAVQSNPHLRLIISDPCAEKNVKSEEPSKKYWRRLMQLACLGSDVLFINAGFSDLASLVPDLHSLNSSERLAVAVRAVGKIDEH